MNEFLEGNNPESKNITNIFSPNLMHSLYKRKLENPHKQIREQERKEGH